MIRWRLSAAAALLSTFAVSSIIAAGCGSSDSATPRADASAPQPNDGADGSDAGVATGDDGGAPVGDAGGRASDGGPVDAKQACIDYLTAYCAKELGCGVRDVTCPALIPAACPEYLFAAGSTRTPRSVEACASQIEALSCDQMVARVLPACVTPGTLAPGEPCVFASQCASLYCTHGTGACGTCAALPTPEAGTRCGDDLSCAPGFVCAVSRGVCWPEQPQGQPCTPSANPPTNCKSGLTCLATDGGVTGACGTLPGVGASCVRELTPFSLSVATCSTEQGLGCVPSDGGSLGTCEGPAPIHGACVFGQCDATHACAIADGSTFGTCEPLPGAGSPCAHGACASGAYCDLDHGGAMPLCQASVALGQPCQQLTSASVYPCVTGAACSPQPSGTCAPGSRGAACAGPSGCLYPLACGDAGMCEPAACPSPGAPDAGPG
jgi:hypothetical protein